jgi:hypothetical protein
VTLLVALTFNLVQVVAQTEPERGARAKTEDKVVTLEGKVVDLHGFMTGAKPTDNLKQCAECIRAGVPCALQTDTDLVVLGQGMTGPARAVADHAMQQVTIRGKLFEKSGVKYLDIETVEPKGGAMGRQVPSGTTP